VTPQLSEADAEAVQRRCESRACRFGVVLIERSPRVLHSKLLESDPQMGELRPSQQIEQPLGLMGTYHVRRDRPDHVRFDDPGSGSGQHERFDRGRKQRGPVVHDRADQWGDRGEQCGCADESREHASAILTVLR